ncbi:MAG TPA: SRPBCC family protein [Ktedonobacteraceae bacterium]|nr:SRPBCC family protein [Ktedonobacteraceae bacterium]
MEQKMVEHHAAVTVDAPIHQVYSLFSHFNDFPKFMSFVKEVTYHDEQSSHWVADVAGRHEWDAVNENWIPDQQIGWRSFAGLKNAGRVVFQPTSTQQTHIDVYVDYDPPASLLGSIGEHLGVGKHFEDVLQKDLNHFAEMVHQAPPGALDPISSNYLFHQESAAARGTTTQRQDQTMGRDASTSGYARGEDTSYAAPTDASTPVRNDYAEDYTTRSNTGTTAQGSAVPREGIPLDRPILDRDIVNEPPNIASSAGRRNESPLPGYADTDEANVPPEQIPRWESPEGKQQQP